MEISTMTEPVKISLAPRIKQKLITWNLIFEELAKEFERNWVFPVRISQEVRWTEEVVYIYLIIKRHTTSTLLLGMWVQWRIGHHTTPCKRPDWIVWGQGRAKNTLRYHRAQVSQSHRHPMTKRCRRPRERVFVHQCFHKIHRWCCTPPKISPVWWYSINRFISTRIFKSVLKEDAYKLAHRNGC